MSDENQEVQLTKLETVFSIGIVGCMLFATWELGHLMADEWFSTWVDKNAFINRRIILYGLAALMSITSIFITIKFAFKLGRFGQIVNRAFLWYGTLLLISTIAIFVFDCLPEVFAGFIGAIVFITAIFIVQRKFLTKERIIRIRLAKGNCFNCGEKLHLNSIFCASCGTKVGNNCLECNTYIKISDKFCSSCGIKIVK